MFCAIAWRWQKRQRDRGRAIYWMLLAQTQANALELHRLSHGGEDPHPSELAHAARWLPMEEQAAMQN